MRIPLWPQSLFGRLIAALVIAVVLAQAASLYLYAIHLERFVLDSSVREWSRRITEEHRMVYRVDGDSLLIAQLRYHY